MEQIIYATHSNPHDVLGCKKIGNKKSIVRAFFPYAYQISVVTTKNSYPMQKVHSDGFFEVIIPEINPDYCFEITFRNNKLPQRIHDPYSFSQVISDIDLYLFGQGTHYEIFNKLGAHPMTINKTQGVLFAVWAPNAKRVSVISDFNNWDGRCNPMRSLGNSGVWELFIPNVSVFTKYKFEIKTQADDILKKADPYANYAELRPATASVIVDINKFKWSDEKWMSERKSSGPINIYEVHLGSWRKVVENDNRSMNYRELAQNLIPYVKNMGYTHIELMPVQEHPFDGSWGYQVTGYYAPTSRYGTPEDFMYFVNECHRNNIGVLLDWVPAHFPKDEHALAKFDGSALYEHADTRKGEHPDWGTLIFNYGRHEVKNFLIANALFWLGKYHIDGLRVDAVASMLYLDYSKKPGEWIPNGYGGNENLEAIEFMKHMNSIVHSKFPSALMIAEESTAWSNVSRPVEWNGLGFDLKWNMGWMNDFLRYIGKDCIHRKYHHNLLTFSMVYAYTENFVLVLSHDEVVHGKGSLINKMPGDLWQKFANVRLTLGFMIGHPGKKLSFMGNEIAQFDEWTESKSLDWHLLEFQPHKQIQNYVRDLNLLYQNEIALWYDDFTCNGFEWIDCNDSDRSIVSFIRKSDNDTVIFVCNFTPVPLMNHRIGVPFNGQYKEIMNSDDLKYGGSGIINHEIMMSTEESWNNRRFSIGIKVPPLGISVLKFIHQK